jgi:hypothetical protein
MKWIAWLLTSTMCLAGHGGPLPEIQIGTSQKELAVHAVPTFQDDGCNHQTFLVGTVTEVAAEEDRQPQRTRLSESCILHVDSAFGYLKEVTGIQTAVLKASYEQSPYALIEENWGKLWHFKKGQKLIVILHLDRGEPCCEVEELMVLNERTETLPDILRRTALLPEEFTDDDLEVLKHASPYLHQQVLAEAAVEREMHAEESRLRRDTMMKAAGICALVVLVAWVIRKMRR